MTAPCYDYIGIFQFMSFLFPKQPIFFELLKDLHSELEKITVLFDEFSHEFNHIEDYARRAKEIEHQADIKTHAIIDTLNKTFITPFDREDIYLLAHEFDDIVDLIENVIKFVGLYGITERIGAMAQFVPLINEATLELGKLLDSLHGQKYTEQLAQAKIHIHELEDQGDHFFSQAIGKLLREETDAIKVLKIKEILEGLEHIMDKYQKVSDIIEGIVVKSS